MRLLARCYRQTADHPQGTATSVSSSSSSARPQAIARTIRGFSRGLAVSAIRYDLATAFHTWTARGRNPFAACVEAL
jgi:hypothetical protein